MQSDHGQINVPNSCVLWVQFDNFMRTLYKKIADFCTFQGAVNIHQHED